MRKLTIPVLAALLVAWAVLPMFAKDPSNEQAFMRAKLLHSQKVLEALALQDFTGIAKHAEQLKLISLDANWQVLSTDEYVLQSKAFRQAADGLAAAAEKKNIDGAVLAYFQMTQSCVHCHQHLRDQK